MLSYIKHIIFIFLTINLFASVNFTDPTSTTGTGHIPPNLSEDNRNAEAPQIATSSTGRYVYAIWDRHNGSHYIVQTARSSNYGVDWVNPTTTTGSAGTPNLSDNGTNAYHSQIATNSTGQYVYAVWDRSNIVQVARSTDYGDNWVKSTSTPVGAGNNLSGSSSQRPQIATSLTCP